MMPLRRLAFAFTLAASFASAGASATETRAVGVIGRAIPSVVAIHTVQYGPVPANIAPNAGRGKDGIVQAEGSGFIIAADGIIATNRHVVEGAYKITVTLDDGATVPAKPVWSSSVVDVAFLKINPTRGLPVVTLAHDERLRLGQRVFAIGNPRGLGTSVSSGIVSALHRHINESPFDDFIQTDAAINQGNSGGPLLNEDGEVVGMTSLLYETVGNGGSEGLGFAIPGSDLFFLINQIRRTGHILCGWLGLKGQALTPAIKDAIGFAEPSGVIISEVVAKSPAEAAGMRKGDIVEDIDDAVPDSEAALNRAICFAQGRTVTLKVWRDGRLRLVRATATPVDDTRYEDTKNQLATPISVPRFASARDLGIQLRPLDETSRRRFIIHHGVLVGGIVGSSEAEAVGLRAGDVIESLANEPLTSPATFNHVFARLGRANKRYALAYVYTAKGPHWIAFPVRSVPVRSVGGIVVAPQR